MIYESGFLSYLKFKILFLKIRTVWKEKSGEIYQHQELQGPFYFDEKLSNGSQLLTNGKRGFAPYARVHVAILIVAFGFEFPSI